MKQKSIGRAPDNDLVLEDDSVAALHAHAELAPDGTIYITCHDQDAPLFLLRGERRQPVRRVSLCLDDRLLFGNCEVRLSRLTALFGAATGARLRHREEPPAMLHVREEVQPRTESAPAIPRRNPVTGKIEN
jgi:hypothetical protein